VKKRANKPRADVTAALDDVDLPPPRRRPRRRIFIAVVLVAAALVGVRLWWGWVADRRLNAALAELRALGALPPPLRRCCCGSW